MNRNWLKRVILTELYYLTQDRVVPLHGLWRLNDDQESTKWRDMPQPAALSQPMSEPHHVATLGLELANQLRAVFE